MSVCIQYMVHAPVVHILIYKYMLPKPSDLFSKKTIKLLRKIWDYNLWGEFSVESRSEFSGKFDKVNINRSVMGLTNTLKENSKSTAKTWYVKPNICLIISQMSHPVNFILWLDGLHAGWLRAASSGLMLMQPRSDQPKTIGTDVIHGTWS